MLLQWQAKQEYYNWEPTYTTNLPIGAFSSFREITRNMPFSFFQTFFSNQQPDQFSGKKKHYFLCVYRLQSPYFQLEAAHE